MKKLLTLSVFASSVFGSTVLAEKPDVNSYATSLEFAQVTDVLTTQKADGSWCFGVSVRHDDQGWEHYADGWQVFDLDGKPISFRLLAHPHVNEQPFTRSQCNIDIPAGVSQVIVRAKCNKHGYGGKPFVVNLSKS